MEIEFIGLAREIKVKAESFTAAAFAGRW